MNAQNLGRYYLSPLVGSEDSRHVGSVYVDQYSDVVVSTFGHGLIQPRALRYFRFSAVMVLGI